MYSNDFDSVTNNLRDSANGTFVTFDDVFRNTATVRKAVAGVRGRIPLHAKNGVFVLRTWEPEDRPSTHFSRRGVP